LEFIHTVHPSIHTCGWVEEAPPVVDTVGRVLVSEAGSEVVGASVLLLTAGVVLYTGVVDNVGVQMVVKMVLATPSSVVVMICVVEVDQDSVLLKMDVVSGIEVDVPVLPDVRVVDSGVVDERDVVDVFGEDVVRGAVPDVVELATVLVKVGGQVCPDTIRVPFQQ
jgi:hypothetical protein